MAAVSTPTTRRDATTRKRAGAAHTRRGTGPSPEDKLVAALVSLLEQGTTPWRRPWDCTGGGHHVNLLTGHRYRGANPILLTLGMHLRGSALPYWCGYAEAKAAGLTPRRGSQAVRILRPQIMRGSDSSDTQDRADSTDTSGTPGSTSRTPGADPSTPTTWVLYRPVAVFNAADLEGASLAGLVEARKAAAGEAQRPEPQRLAAAEAVLSTWQVPVSHGGAHACYLPQVDRIQLPDRSAFHSAEALYATWAHEAVHSTGHASRLKRDLSGRMGCPRYAREELVAELGSVLLGQRLEIGCDLVNHAAYLEHWVALLRESPRVLFQVLSDSRRAADLICPEPELGAQSEVAAPS